MNTVSPPRGARGSNPGGGPPPAPAQNAPRLTRQQVARLTNLALVASVIALGIVGGVLFYLFPKFGIYLTAVLVGSGLFYGIIRLTRALTASVAWPGFLTLLALLIFAFGSYYYWRRPNTGKPAAQQAGATQTQKAPAVTPREIQLKARPPCRPDKQAPKYSEWSPSVTIKPGEAAVIQLSLDPREGARWEWTHGKLEKRTRYTERQEIITLTPSEETKIKWAVYPCSN